MKSLVESLRTLLILGRVSNLPTVWSNLIVGWIIADGPWGGLMRRDYHGPDDTPWPISFVLLGGSFLYVGGMYLNDYCDAGFDARYCPGRPIPAGKISRRAVGVIAGLWFASGLACLFRFGPITAAIALLLLAAIVLYDFQHKNVSWAPLLMGACRFLLYPLAASAAVSRSISLYVFVAGAALGFYVAGITYLARGESRPGKPTRWALLLLLLPIAVSCGIYACSNSPYRAGPLMAVALTCLLQLYWMAWLLVPFWRKSNPSIGRVVSGLLAGIVLVDVIALVPQDGPLGIVLFPLFALALLLQRIIPAT